MVRTEQEFCGWWFLYNANELRLFLLDKIRMAVDRSRTAIKKETTPFFKRMVLLQEAG